MKLCMALQGNNFSSDYEAEKTLDQILNIIGAKKNFVLTPCSEINNAFAVSYKGIRYILYDKSFIKLISSKTNYWSSIAILAHEVGHHINGHTKDLNIYQNKSIEPASMSKKRQQELEADEFSGFILAKLGATINQALSFTNIFIEKDDTYDSHPSKSKRISAIKSGFSRGNETLAKNNDYVPDRYKSRPSNITTDVQFYNRAVDHFNSNRFDEAFIDFTTVIYLNKNFADAYFWRAYSRIKSDIKTDGGGDIEDVCYDWNKALNLGFERQEDLKSLINQYCN